MMQFLDSPTFGKLFVVCFVNPMENILKKHKQIGDNARFVIYRVRVRFSVIVVF
jgi:hypothetical protein